MTAAPGLIVQTRKVRDSRVSIPAGAPDLIEASPQAGAQLLLPRKLIPARDHLVMELPASGNGALCRPPASRPWVPAEGYSASLAAHGVALSPLSPFVAVDGCVAPLISRALRMSISAPPALRKPPRHHLGYPDAPGRPVATLRTWAN